MLLYFLCCFMIVTSAYPEANIDPEKVTLAAEHGAEGRIAGGEDPDRGARAAPFQAQITREGATFCSGTIVSDHCIVTAAHCVEGAKPQELTVRIGSNIRGEGLVVPIEEIVQHPDYDYPQNNYDIAYMRTGEAISYSRMIRSAFIASRNASVPRELHVTGWGYQEDNQKKLADKIRAVDLPVISNSECQVFYPMMSITKNMICAYNLKDMDKGTCVGDGGDPATVSFRLVGVSSAARGCGPGMAPSVFTYVDAEEIRSFILNGISEKTSQRPGYSAKLPQRPSKYPEKDPDECHSKNPGEYSEKAPKAVADGLDHYEKYPGDESTFPESYPDECHSKNPGEYSEKAPKAVADGSDHYKKHPGDESTFPETYPDECHSKNPGEYSEKAPKAVADGLDHYEKYPGDESTFPESYLDECHSKNPGEYSEKAPKAVVDGSDHYKKHPGDESTFPETYPDECHSKNPGEYSEKAPKAVADGLDHYEKYPEDTSKRPEKPQGEHHEKVLKIPVDDSDYYEKHPGYASMSAEKHNDESVL